MGAETYLNTGDVQTFSVGLARIDPELHRQIQQASGELTYILGVNETNLAEAVDARDQAESREQTKYEAEVLAVNFVYDEALRAAKEKHVADTRSVRADHKAAQAAIEDEYDQAANKHTLVKETLGGLQQKLVEYSGQFVAYTDEYTRLSDQKAQTERDLEDETTEFGRLDSEISTIGENLVVNSDEIAEATRSREAAELQFRALEKALEPMDTTQLQSAIELSYHLVDQQTLFSTQLRDLREIEVSLSNQSSATIKRRAVVAGQISSLKDQLEIVSSRMAWLGEQITAVRSAIDEVRAQCAAIEVESTEDPVQEKPDVVGLSLINPEATKAFSGVPGIKPETTTQQEPSVSPVTVFVRYFIGASQLVPDADPGGANA